MKLAAFFFDLDGTLVDTERLYVQAMERVLAQEGIHLSREEALALVYGRAWCDIYADVRRDYPGLGADECAMQESIRHEMAALQGEADVRIDGSIALLVRLAGEYPVAVVSGSLRQDIAESLEYAGVSEHVRFIIASEDYARGKPDPAPYRLAAERLAVAPGSCVAFEDSAAGVASAKAAGMRAVALARDGGPVQDFSHADLVLADLSLFRLEALT